MQPRQIRETTRPLRPNWVYCITGSGGVARGTADFRRVASRIGRRVSHAPPAEILYTQPIGRGCLVTSVVSVCRTTMILLLPARVYSHASKLAARYFRTALAAVPIAVFISGLFAATAIPTGAQTVSQAIINLFSGARLYVDPASEAKRQADAWRRTRPADAALMDKIAAQPLAQWLGGWNLDIGRDVSDAVSRITGARSLPVFVAYNIPGRDCGQYSAGGANGSDAYQRWIRAFANGIANRRA